MFQRTRMRANSRAASAGSSELTYRVRRGDPLVQDYIFTRETLSRGLAKLAAKPGVGQLAYTPDMRAHFEVTLERNFADDKGPESGFPFDTYGVFVDPEMAKFYGVDVSAIPQQNWGREEIPATIERLLDATVAEVALLAPGLIQQEQFWKTDPYRLLRATDDMVTFDDPDNQLFRNPTGGWCTIDRPISCDDKRNTIALYNAPGEKEPTGYTSGDLYPNGIHPAWLNAPY